MRETDCGTGRLGACRVILGRVEAESEVITASAPLEDQSPGRVRAAAESAAERGVDHALARGCAPSSGMLLAEGFALALVNPSGQRTKTGGHAPAASALDGDVGKY